MKTVGILRTLDHLNRVVFPKKITQRLGILPGDAMEMVIDGDKIIFTKHRATCTFCGAQEHLKDHKGKPVCEDCIAEMQRL